VGMMFGTSIAPLREIMHAARMPTIADAYIPASFSWQVATTYYCSPSDKPAIPERVAQRKQPPGVSSAREPPIHFQRWGFDVSDAIKLAQPPSIEPPPAAEGNTRNFVTERAAALAAANRTIRSSFKRG
jgi:hypothetical protein